jgi:ABC-type glycerol-3-phosphate transport system substrate-binding protein
MPTKISKRLLLGILLIGVPALMFAAGQQVTTGEEPVAILYYRPGTNPNPAFIDAINAKLNIKLEFISESWNNMPEKRNLMLAAGDTLDILMYMEGDKYWVDEGLIQPLDDLITKERHPYLYKVTHSKTFEAMKFDGKIYYYPGVSHGSHWSMGVRYDWMQKLGFDMPQDEVEFRDMLEAFVDMDPTGTTVGMQLEGQMAIRRSMFPILATFGVPISEFDMNRNFYFENGQLKSVLLMDNLKKAFAYVNKLYNEKLVNTDFAGFNSYPMLNEKYWFAGKCGVAYGAFGNQELTIQKVDPAAVIESIPPWSARGHKFQRGSGAMMVNHYAIPTSSKHPLKALDLLEFLNTKEGRIMSVAGAEGVQWKNYTEDGFYDQIEENWDPDHNYEYGFGTAEMRGYLPWGDYDTFEEAYDNRTIIVERGLKDSKASIKNLLEWGAKWRGELNPFRFVIIPELIDTDTAIWEAVEIGWIKMIAAGPGKFEDEWNEYVDSLNDAGIENWVESFQEYYDKNMK